MKIKAIAVAVPDWIVENDQISEWSGLDRTMLEEKIGVSRRRFLRHNETGTDLSVRAVNALANDNPDFDISRVRLMIVVTQNPDYRIPHNSALLQHRIGLNSSAACFDISLGCSGYVYALSVAKGFMLAEGIDEALIVTCDPYSKCMAPRNRDVIGLFGDAATVTWLRADGLGTIGRGEFGTDGSGASHLIVRAGGSAQPFAHLDGTDALPLEPGDDSLHMTGRAIFNFMMTRVPVSVDACLLKNNLIRSDIDSFVFHQASRFLLETLRDRMGLPAEQVPITLKDTGNTVSSTVPLALHILAARGRCDNATVLVSGFGVGLSWATNIIRFGASS